MRFRYMIILFITTFTFFYLNGEEPYDVQGGEHFRFLLYDKLDPAVTIEISENLESSYQRILDDLGVRRMPRVTVSIWDDYTNFLDKMKTDLGTRYQGADGYIFGMTELRIYHNADAAKNAVHEFAHLVSMQVNRNIGNNPRWLWEAVALYENNEFVDPGSLPYIACGNRLTLDDLNADFNHSNHYIYSVGYVLLEYIVLTWGMDAVIKLIRNNGNLFGVLNISVQEFESGWHQFIEEKYLN